MLSFFFEEHTYTEGGDNRLRSVDTLLRLGIAFSFLYAAVSALIDPVSWIGFFPAFLRDLSPSDALLLQGFGAVEAVIALWLLSGKKLFIPATTAALMLGGIVVFNWGARDIVFRDIPIALSAVALALIHRPSRAG